LWIFWMAGTLVLGFIDTRQLQSNGVRLRGWEPALNLVLPPVYFFVRNRAIVSTTGKDQPAHGWLYATWVAAVGVNVICCGLISADRLLRVAKDAAILIAWVLLMAVLWSIGERLYTSLWKRS